MLNNVTIVIYFDMCRTWERKASLTHPKSILQVNNFLYEHLALTITYVLLYLSPSLMLNVNLALPEHMYQWNISETSAFPWNTNLPFFHSVVLKWYEVEVFSDFFFLWTLFQNGGISSSPYRYMTLCQSIDRKSVLVQKAHAFPYLYIFISVCIYKICIYLYQ